MCSRSTMAYGITYAWLGRVSLVTGVSSLMAPLWEPEQIGGQEWWLAREGSLLARHTLEK